MFDASIGALILAGGKGTRLYSTRPKVLQTILETPLLEYVYARFDPLFGKRVWTIVGFGHEALETAFPHAKERFILQSPQRGTGHALQVAWPTIRNSGVSHLVVANGDTPFVSEQALEDLVNLGLEENADIAFLSIVMDDPGSYGRVVRKSNGSVSAIVEARDFERMDPGDEIHEVNSGIYLLRVDAVNKLLPLLTDDNAQQELYITQLVDLACSTGMRVVAIEQGDGPELFGINTPQELVDAENRLCPHIVQDWIDQGVIIRNREVVRIGPKVELAPGVDITGPCEIYGHSVLGPGTRVHSHCRIENSQLNGCQVHSFSHIHNAQVGKDCSVGPYARLRPGTVLDRDVRVGNFVEIKKGVMGEGSKASHLTYIGDAVIGKGVNIGAGTITCNYDGTNKHMTHIGDGSFIGSNTAMVAPVRIGRDVLVGAGTVVTKDVPDESLCIARAKQKNLKR
ncbi:bifunctional UDP-N-acetylglucosamine diphosphorylase/glucosamine-1-phosphate N-acetyltransferase GlmU [Desulfoplanes formicivorans]|uniref:Bifunctional protein GlmU n=1 Tax=Desulfoplanes formicivorans TaxID=1592317 RepID=A0A194AIW6_9BACT|nr:bifunctional UDP-N-acetylglucosamine diphosphorylase/glucosamine-1-phosphate N-acetyltransferase GlmU [Desulfoplanes formicivorans]GAU08689.1 N-acetylglucosamine-1-phosphate uridyltransferase [Desulfoplanes formicivorans]